QAAPAADSRDPPQPPTVYWEAPPPRAPAAPQVRDGVQWPGHGVPFARGHCGGKQAAPVADYWEAPPADYWEAPPPRAPAQRGGDGALGPRRAHCGGTQAAGSANAAAAGSPAPGDETVLTLVPPSVPNDPADLHRGQQGEWLPRVVTVMIRRHPDRREAGGPAGPHRADRVQAPLRLRIPAPQFPHRHQPGARVCQLRHPERRRQLLQHVEPVAVGGRPPRRGRAQDPGLAGAGLRGEHQELDRLQAAPREEPRVPRLHRRRPVRRRPLSPARPCPRAPPARARAAEEPRCQPRLRPRSAASTPRVRCRCLWVASVSSRLQTGSGCARGRRSAMCGSRAPSIGTCMSSRQSTQISWVGTGPFSLPTPGAPPGGLPGTHRRWRRGAGRGLTISAGEVVGSRQRSI
ncbi:unnamed protein product, partial [Prorocentrum cordatum]